MGLVCLAGGVPVLMDLTVVVDPDTIGLRFNSNPNSDYRLQFNNQAASGPWTNAPFTIHGTGDEITVFDPDGYSTQKTYRLIALPQ